MCGCLGGYWHECSPVSHRHTWEAKWLKAKKWPLSVVFFLGTINHTQATWIRSVSLHTFCVHKCPVLSAKRKSKKLYRVPYAHKPIVRPKAADKESRVSSDGKLSTTRVDKERASGLHNLNIGTLGTRFAQETGVNRQALCCDSTIALIGKHRKERWTRAEVRSFCPRRKRLPRVPYKGFSEYLIASSSMM